MFIGESYHFGLLPFVSLLFGVLLALAADVAPASHSREHLGERGKCFWNIYFLRTDLGAGAAADAGGGLFCPRAKIQLA